MPSLTFDSPLSKIHIIHSIQEVRENYSPMFSLEFMKGDLRIAKYEFLFISILFYINAQTYPLKGYRQSYRMQKCNG